MECSVFNEIQDQIDNIEKFKMSSVFIILCGMTENNVSYIQQLLNKPAIHAAYILQELHSSELFTLDQNFKLSGIFSSHEDLLVQLVSDICFYP